MGGSEAFLDAKVCPKTPKMAEKRRQNFPSISKFSQLTYQFFYHNFLDILFSFYTHF